MGYADAFTYASAEEVFEEIKQFWNPKTGYDLRGVSYERLARTPVQWPARRRTRRADDDAATRSATSTTGSASTLLERPDGTRPRLAFPTPSGRAVFFARPHLAAREMPDDDYPFVLNTGRLQHQWHTLTKTGKVAKLNKLNPGPFVEIHPDDAAAARRSPTATRSRSPRAAAGPCCPRPSPTGCGPATASRRSTGTTSSASTWHQRGHQRRRRPALVPARVQGVRGLAHQARAARRSRRPAPSRGVRRRLGGPASS